MYCIISLLSVFEVEFFCYFLILQGIKPVGEEISL